MPRPAVAKPEAVPPPATIVGPIPVLYSALASLVRALPLLVGNRPGTPLRALCIAALDHVHRCTCGNRLPSDRVQALSSFLVFAAESNAQLDGKPFCPQRLLTATQTLEAAGWGDLLHTHLQNLTLLEMGRPAMPHHDCEAVRQYRENVVRLSIGSLLLLTQPKADAGFGASTRDFESALVQLAMLFQVADDLLDLATDTRAQLPSLATALVLEPAPKKVLAGWISHYAQANAHQPGAATFLLCGLGRGLGWSLRQLVMVLPSKMRPEQTQIARGGECV